MSDNIGDDVESEELWEEAEKNLEARGEPSAGEEADVRDFLGSMQLMHEEHEAWINACKTLRSFGVDVNIHEEIAFAFAFWGECLHALRATQEPHVVKTARTEAEDRLRINIDHTETKEGTT